ncbi:MAG TPA: 16S rRNA (uracil(1498)-N(3))-methyltransferase [Desulfosalsimonadaceae bacterium]|nr:16S rRNA (uracil(1498)-N(3))-methyltransferase [Desulfosalsimonadaceae bacterium]
MRRFHIGKDQIMGDAAEISGTEARHIRTVLRMKPGDFLELVDGSGYAYEARIHSVSGEVIQAEILRKYRSGSESGLKMTIAIGFLKDKKMDTLVRHLTELGMSRFLPVWTARSIARPPEKRLHSRLQRWESIATEAVKQSRRDQIPEIARPAAFEEALALGQKADAGIIFREQADQSLHSAVQPMQGVQEVFVLLGPEGGFAESEARQAAAAGLVSVSMGPRILRAETAAITACALLQYLLGDTGKKSP